jgi:uncharacterized protein with GYD domain
LGRRTVAAAKCEKRHGAKELSHNLSPLCGLFVACRAAYVKVDWAHSLREDTLTTYIALFSLTEAGIKAAKDSPRRLDAAKKLLADMGGEMKQFYMVMGEFDFVGICEAPDDAVMARYVLQVGGLGFVRTKTMKAFPETAYREIVRSLA